MNLWLLLPLLLPMLVGLFLLTKPFAEGKIRRLTVQIGLILTLVSLLPWRLRCMWTESACASVC